MVNFRVADLHALLAVLREEGCDVQDRLEESEFGKFGWVMDPEGNKIRTLGTTRRPVARAPPALIANAGFPVQLTLLPSCHSRAWQSSRRRSAGRVVSDGGKERRA